MSARFAAVLLLAAAIPLAAQQSSIQGIVTDSTHAPIAQAEVTVSNSATGVSQTTVANDQGFYAIPFLIPGKYSVKASARGFAAISMTEDARRRRHRPRRFRPGP